MVIKSKERTGSLSWKTANIFWDHSGYVLGYPSNSDQSYQKEAAEKAYKQNKSFVSIVKYLAARFPDNEEIEAVRKFYDIPENKHKIQRNPLWEECIEGFSKNLTFRVTGRTFTVAENPDVLPLANEEEKTFELPKGICLVTGEYGPIAMLNSAITIPGEKRGAKLIGFQKNRVMTLIIKNKD